MNSSNNFNNNFNQGINNFNNENNYIISPQNILSYKKSWSQELNLYNQLMSQGYSDYSKNKLKGGIKGILIELDKIESMLSNYKGPQEHQILLKLKSDMIQTCSRYEKYINQESYEHFYSAFEGNNRIYSFNKEKLFPDENKSEEKKEDKENRYFKNIKKFTGFVKKSITTVGKKVKDGTYKGYNFVKDKVSKNEDKSKEKKSNDKEDNEAAINFMNNVDEITAKTNFQNNQNNFNSNNQINQNYITQNNNNNCNQNNNYCNQNNYNNNQNNNNYNNQNNYNNNQNNNYNNQNNYNNNQNNYNNNQNYNN